MSVLLTLSPGQCLIPTISYCHLMLLCQCSGPPGFWGNKRSPAHRIFREACLFHSWMLKKLLNKMTHISLKYSYLALSAKSLSSCRTLVFRDIPFSILVLVSNFLVRINKAFPEGKAFPTWCFYIYTHIQQEFNWPLAKQCLSENKMHLGKTLCEKKHFT